MEKSPLFKLDLRAPIFYTKTAHENFTEGHFEEILLCYSVNPAQSSNIEPDREYFLENLVFAGEKTSDGGTEEETQEGKDGQKASREVILPQGHYLFVQNRRHLNREEWLDLAIEQQKDGLWERNKLENLLYVRYLYEDGAYVTQIFRPLAG